MNNENNNGWKITSIVLIVLMVILIPLTIFTSIKTWGNDKIYDLDSLELQHLNRNLSNETLREGNIVNNQESWDNLTNTLDGYIHEELTYDHIDNDVTITFDEPLLLHNGSFITYNIKSNDDGKEIDSYFIYGDNNYDMESTKIVDDINIMYETDSYRGFVNISDSISNNTHNYTIIGGAKILNKLHNMYRTFDEDTYTYQDEIDKSVKDINLDISNNFTYYIDYNDNGLYDRITSIVKEEKHLTLELNKYNTSIDINGKTIDEYIPKDK